jgi:hypothetical protein
MERHLKNETRRMASGRARQAAVAMKKLDVLIAGFADEVFRTIRGATLEELAELRGSALPESRERPVRAGGPAAASASRKAAPWRAPRRLAPESWRRTREEERPERIKPQGAPHAQNAQNSHVVAEITDPESLLRFETLAPTAHAEPPQEAPPPISTEKPISSAPVPLRANEALVRASGAGIVIRRRKGA